MHITFKTSREECDFSFKPSSWESPLGQSSLLFSVSSVRFFFCQGLCQWDFSAVLLSLCVASGMLRSLLWQLLCGHNLVHVHSLLDPKSWLWSQQGCSCLLFPPFSLLNFRWLCHFAYIRELPYSLAALHQDLHCSWQCLQAWGSPNLFQIKSCQQELPVGYRVCARSSGQAWAALQPYREGEGPVLSKATVTGRRGAWGPWTAQTLWGPISSECWFVPVILSVSQSNIQRKFPHYLVESLTDEDRWLILRSFRASIRI